MADLEDDFTAKAEQSVLMGEDQFLDLALEQEQQKLFEASFLVVESAAQVPNDQVDRFASFLLDVLLLPLQVRFLIVG